MNNQAQTKPAQGGVAIFDDKLNAALSVAAQTYDALRMLNERLYNPIPQTNKDGAPTPVQNTVEGNLEMLLTRLREVDALANKLLHG